MLNRGRDRKKFEEGFATGFAWGTNTAYGSIRMVLAEGHLSPDEGGHANNCKCKPCDLIRDVLAARRKA